MKNEFLIFLFAIFLLLFFIFLFKYKDNRDLTISNFPSSQEVSVSNFPSSQTTELNGLNTDIFGRVKVSNPYHLNSLTHTSGKNEFYYSEKIVSSGTSTFIENMSLVEMSVSGDGDKVTRQTIRYAIYQPSRAMVPEFTFNLNPPTDTNGGSNDTNTIVRVGAFDDENGYFFEYSNQTVYLVERSYVTGSVVDTKVPRDEWNISSLTSGDYIFDVSKSHIGFVEIQWLGVGDVIISLQGSRKIYQLHKFSHAGKFPGTYITNANLPIRYEISSSGGSASLYHICSSVTSEGGWRPDGIVRALSNVDPSTTISNSGQKTGGRGYADVDNLEVILLGIRLKSIDDLSISKFANIRLLSYSTSFTDNTKRLLYTVYIVKDSSTSPITGSNVNWSSYTPKSPIEFVCNLEITSGNTAFDKTNAAVVEMGTINGRSERTINDIDLNASNMMLSRGLNGSDYLFITGRAYVTNANLAVSNDISWIEIF